MNNFILWLILGTIIGWLASLILHPDGHRGAWLDIGIGAVGAFLAGFAFAPLMGANPVTQGNYSFPALLGSLLGALLLLGTVKLFRRLGQHATYPASAAMARPNPWPGLLPFSWSVWAILGLPEVILALRFVLKLMGANPNSGLVILIYKLTEWFILPFRGLVAPQISGEAVLELATLIAMAIYAQLFWAMVTAGLILMDRFRTRAIPTKNA